MPEVPGTPLPPEEADAVAEGTWPGRTFDAGWEGHRRRQLVAGLALTPAQRLRWLEETMDTMRRWCGRAAHGRPMGGEHPVGDRPATR